MQSRRKIIVISRCAWTLFNFRRSLIDSIKASADVIALGAGGDGYDIKLRTGGVDFRAIPVARRGLSPIGDLRLMIELIREFRKERPDVVHCFTIKPAIYGTIAAWLCNVPARIVTITGLGHAFTSADRWLNRVVTILYKVALARAHLVYFQNSEDQQLFLQRGLLEPAKAKLCAGSGVDVQRFAPAALPVSRGSPPKFLMIARLIREKGIVEFVEAAIAIKRQYPDVQFAVLGGGDPRNPSAVTPAEFDALRGSGVVTWLGETDDVRPYIAEADAVVLPSYREGLPRSLLEAGAMGRPAIATDTVGCRDVVVHGVTGWLVPPRNSEALADAMRVMIDNPLQMQSMGAAARVRIAEYFDERAVVESTVNDYRLLLERD